MFHSADLHIRDNRAFETFFIRIGIQCFYSDWINASLFFLSIGLLVSYLCVLCSVS